ncbi:hypothetical protein H0H92_007647, partial [Tricholoma furcatifolium]
MDLALSDDEFSEDLYEEDGDGDSPVLSEELGAFLKQQRTGSEVSERQTPHFFPGTSFESNYTRGSPATSSTLSNGLGLSNLKHIHEVQPARPEVHSVHRELDSMKARFRTLSVKYQSSKKNISELRAEIERLRLEAQLARTAFQDALSIVTGATRPSSSVSSMPTPILQDSPLLTPTLPLMSTSDSYTHISHPPTVLDIPPRPQQKDYPNIKYWYKYQWLADKQALKDSGDSKKCAKGRARQAQGVNVMLRYIEDSNGKVVDGFMAQKIRKLARTIWQSFAESGILPSTWGKASREANHQYRKEMERAFPVLALCDDHWKVDTIATEAYPSWYSSRFRIKEEPEAVHVSLGTTATATPQSKVEITGFTGSITSNPQEQVPHKTSIAAQVSLGTMATATTDSEVEITRRITPTPHAQVPHVPTIVGKKRVASEPLPTQAAKRPKPRSKIKNPLAAVGAQITQSLAPSLVIPDTVHLTVHSVLTPTPSTLQEAAQ